jgi:hypothetical protein
LIAVIIFSGQVSAQKSTRQDFDDFCRAWEGRWVCEQTLVADSPGIGKKGDTFTAYADCRIEHDGQAMICKYYGGEGTATWVVAYDAGASRIKGLWVTSGGVFQHCTLHKEGQDWVEVVHGSQAGGTKIEATFTITITDEGDTHNWKGTPVIDGKKTAEETSQWHRVNK